MKPTIVLVRAVLTAGWMAGIPTATADTFEVIYTLNSGEGSLRQAMTEANANAGPDMITFNIPGAGPHAISPSSALPVITETVTIAGGAACSNFFSATLPIGIADGMFITATATAPNGITSEFSQCIAVTGMRGGPIPVLSVALPSAGNAVVSWTPDTGTNWILQQKTFVSPSNWTNSPTGFTNPVVVPPLHRWSFTASPNPEVRTSH